MELKEGMYVRTENGVIEKVNKIYDRHATDNIVVWLNGYGDGKSVFIDDFEEIKFQSINSRGFIKKEPSFNIIDLIEVGDYVNGVLITNISEDNKDKYVFGYSKDGFEGEIWFYNNEIETIVTKEMFANAEYKVETN